MTVAMPYWNPEISLGNVIAIAGLVLTIVRLHLSNVRRAERIELKVDLIFKWFQDHVIGKAKNDG